MKTKVGITLIALPILSVAFYAFTGQVWWVDASHESGRQFLIGMLHYVSLCSGGVMFICGD
jgi:hypothetical protein